MKVASCIIVTSLLVTTPRADPLSDNIALFWNLYETVTTGTKILTDITEGVGAVSNAIAAIDAYLAKDKTDATVPEVDVKTLNSVDLISEDVCALDDKLCSAKVSEIPSLNEAISHAHPTEHALPKFSGCGALGFHIRNVNLPVLDMTDCCSVHDTCYGKSCRSNKRDCDSKLKKCLFKVCDPKQVEKSHQKSCKAAAKLLFSGTMALSYQQYKDAQDLLKCSRSIS